MHEPPECAFKVFSRKFLVFRVHHRGVRVDPAEATTIATRKRPTTITKLKSFLGRDSCIRRLVPGLAIVTSELSKLLKKEVEFTWGSEQ